MSHTTVANLKTFELHKHIISGSTTTSNTFTRSLIELLTCCVVYLVVVVALFSCCLVQLLRCCVVELLNC